MKLPKIKLPTFKLPKIKLPKFGKGDDDEEFDEEFDEDFGEDFDPDVYSGDRGDGADFHAAEEAKAARRAEAEGEGEDDMPPSPAAEQVGTPDDGLPPSPASDAMEGPDGGTPPSPASESILSEDEMESAEGMPTPSAHHTGDMPDFDDDDEDDEDDEEGGRKFAMPSKKVMIAGAGALAGLLILGGGAWWFFSGDDGEGVNIASQEDGGGLTPPGGEEGGGASDGPDYDANSLNAIGQRDAAGPGLGVVVPPVTAAAFEALAAVEGVAALSQAPDPALAERSAYGLLPKVAEDGRKPWQVYARPFDAKGADVPKIAVVVTGLGLSQAAVDAAITRLPPEVTLAFDPYAHELSPMADKARAHGHETLISLPLESGVFPLFDPGSKALTTANKPEENAVVLHDVMAGMTGYVGVFTTFGSKFNQSEHHVKILMDEFKQRGIMVVDGGYAPKSDIPKVATQVGVPRAKVDLAYPEDPSAAGMAAYFAHAEELARKRAVAVIAMEAYPSALRALVPWIAELKQKNIAVAPISAVADKQFLE